MVRSPDLKHGGPATPVINRGTPYCLAGKRIPTPNTMLILNKSPSRHCFNIVLRERGFGKMNIAFSVQKKLQVDSLFFGVPRSYERDCGFKSRSDH